MEFLFDTPWWFPTAVIGAGAFVWMTGNNRQEKPVMRGGIAIILLGILIAMVSYLVETNRELAIRRTRQLVAAVDQKDWKAFESLIDSQTSIYGIRGPQAITEKVQSGAERFRLSSAGITGMKVDQADTVITITIRIYVEMMGRSGLSDWQLQYQNLGQGWNLYTIRAVSNEQISEEAVRSAVSRQ